MNDFLTLEELISQLWIINDINPHCMDTIPVFIRVGGVEVKIDGFELTDRKVVIYGDEK